jgi:hypothetical protein
MQFHFSLLTSGENASTRNTDDKHRAQRSTRRITQRKTYSQERPTAANRQSDEHDATVPYAANNQG